MRVKGPSAQRKAKYEHSINSRFFGSKPAKLALRFRIEIVDQIGSAKSGTEALEAFAEFPSWHRQHRRQTSGETVENRAKIAIERGENIGQQLTFQLNHVCRSINETKFQVERIVFGQ